MSSLAKFEMAETGVLHLRDAVDEPMYAEGADGQPDASKPLRAHLYGPGSRQYAKALNAKQNHHVDLIKRKGRTRESAEEAMRSNAEFLAACTAKLENIDEPAIEVYMNQKLSFIRDQVAVFLNETENFSQGSTKS